MKRKFIFGILAVLIFIIAFFAWKFYGSAVSTPTGEFLYIKTGSSYEDVKKELVDKKFLSGTSWFDMASKVLRYKAVKPGRYKLTKGMSLFSLVRMLRAGNQQPLKFVITKIRTKEVLASKTGKLFESDSAQMIAFLNNPDSLKPYGLDTNTVMAVPMPLTYSIPWNSSAGKIFQHFYTAYEQFWNADRKRKADSLHLTPIEVITIASIVDEETRFPVDRPNIASVYINRIRQGMKLEADPTVKFAMKNFGLQRILFEHLRTPSPYNTYINAGVPPGPICTPLPETIDAVLNAPATDYIFFVANYDFSGTHIFTTNMKDHTKYANLFRQEQLRRKHLREEKEKAKKDSIDRAARQLQ